MDGIFHVVRAFEDEDVTHTEADVNPVRDMEIICTELVLKDLEYTVNRIDDLDKQVKRTNNKEAKEEMDILIKVKDLLDKNKWVRNG